MANESLPIVEKNDDQIDEFGRYFFCVLVQKLDQVLEYSRVSTEDRRRICSLFTDNFATFLDNGWIANSHDKLWPVLAFAERVNDSVESIGELRRLVVPNVQSFHSEGGTEGAVIFHFDNDKEAQDLLQFSSGLRGE